MTLGTRTSQTTRIEDAPLLAGKGRFIDDIRIPGLLHAAFVRSPHAHAAIAGHDLNAARASRDIVAVFTAADFAPYLTTNRIVTALPSPSYRQQANRPVLAEGEVVHVGEPVAIVIASSRHAAEDAAALVNIFYDLLPVVTDARAALRSSSPTVHRHSPHNLLAEFDVEFGDVTTTFEQAPHVFRETL